MAKRRPPQRKPALSAARAGGQGELRIIGGDWRSRKLRFPDAGGVRPSPARTRETLFTWPAAIAWTCSPALARWAWKPCPGVPQRQPWWTIPRHWLQPCEITCGC